jgi:deltex-like protein
MPKCDATTARDQQEKGEPSNVHGSEQLIPTTAVQQNVQRSLRGQSKADAAVGEQQHNPGAAPDQGSTQPIPTEIITFQRRRQPKTDAAVEQQSNRGAATDPTTEQRRSARMLKQQHSLREIQQRASRWQMRHASAHSNRTTVFTSIPYRAPASLNEGSEAFRRVAISPDSKEECVICWSPFCDGGDVVALNSCGHHYHQNCLVMALNSDPRCPRCRKPSKKPQGKCPSGTMDIALDEAVTCAGSEDCSGTIVMHYSLPSGKQLAYHENPGDSYKGTARKAYLPNNPKGRDLSMRLMYAWKRGLLFTIGTSMTTGRTGSITWSSVHQKTSTRGGGSSHGFPDPNFFINCNGELDDLHVPPAADLLPRFRAVIDQFLSRSPPKNSTTK